MNVWKLGFILGCLVSSTGFASENALGFLREPRLAGEVHRSFGSPTAMKRQGYGVGFAALFPLPDSGFDLGVRYVYIHEAADRQPDAGTAAFTVLNFVFDYFVWPSKLGGLFVGGEIGVTDPDARDFFSVYSDYVFVGKIGYEYTLPNSHWNATLEARKSVNDDSPLTPTRESNLYSNSIAIGARYRF